MDTQIGLLGEKYSLALDDGSAFNSYNLMLTNLLLYLANVISHDFFIHFGTSFSPSARLKMSREESVSREMSPLTEINSYYLTIFPPFCRNQERILEYLVLRKPNMKESEYSGPNLTAYVGLAVRWWGDPGTQGK